MTAGMYCPNCPCERCRTIQALEAMGDLVYHVPDQDREPFTFMWLLKEYRQHPCKEWTMVESDWRRCWNILNPSGHGNDNRGAFLGFNTTKIRQR